jgi:hypothetical protein
MALHHRSRLQAMPYSAGGSTVISSGPLVLGKRANKIASIKTTTTDGKKPQKDMLFLSLTFK